MKKLLWGFALACCAPHAAAYCVFNELKDREVSVVQEEHPDWKREDARFKAVIKPGASACCEAKDLNCNPNGRHNSIVGLFVHVEGEPRLKCGPVGVPDKMKISKVSGAGTMRIVANPRHDPAAKTPTAPFIVRVWTVDKQDVTGPSGLPCR